LTYVFDIVGTLCTKINNGDYSNAKPITERIDIVNFLYEEGNTIIMQTARGMGRHKNNPQKAVEEFYAMTATQLKNWGVKYHQLFLGKPAGDIYVDDKGIRDENFFRNEFRT